ncbi:MAG: PQQ-binding-like beta-propeller repeat protein [Planctomycetaceae bacterium]|nr:PQQ-binding-like beta-propeller repeat protein [Planctomycetaceae bacterium]
MAFLEVVHMTGDVDRRELSKQSPVSIGSHRSNDICIDEDDVDIMHCRISWAKECYEAVSAGSVPLEVNGAPVKRAQLKSGDVLRFGTVDVRFRDEAGASATSSAPSKQGAKEQQPMDDDVDDWLDDDELIDDEDLDDLDDDLLDDDDGGGMDLLGGLDALAAAEKKSSKPQKKPASTRQPAADPPAPREKPARATSKPAAANAAPAKSGTARDKGAAKEDPAYSSRMRQAMRHHQARPGEEDLLRSPLVLTLLGVSGALLLTGAIFYFLAGRYTAQASFDQARTLYDEGNYHAAIKELDDFAIAYRKEALADEARKLAGLARVEQQLKSKKYEEGLSQLRAFVNAQRDLDGFETVHPDIFERAKTIALEAARQAGTIKNRDLIGISDEARTMVKTYAPKDVPPNEILLEIEDAVRTSEAEILKNATYKDHEKRIKAALGKAPEGVAAAAGEQGPLAAMRIRQDLLVRYPEYERDRTMRELMEQAIAAEKAAIQTEEPSQDALTDDRPGLDTQLTLLFQGRTRSDEVPVGQAVIAVAQDCLYGLDLVTGEPIWRRVIGLDSPFFPITDTATNSVIAFDTRFNELVRVDQHTGAFVWRQPIEARAQGRPHIADGTIFVTTEEGSLLAVDLETGRLRTRLTFSQSISGLTEIKSGQLVVAGDQEVLYEIQKRPLECVRIHYLGQPSGSVEAPLTPLGSYVLMIQNVGENARLRLIETNTQDNPFMEVATSQVSGRVRDEPVAVRGRDLFVPSSGERLSAFSVSDDAGQAPLTAGPVYQGKGDLNRPIHLMTGPDRQVWMASGSLVRVRLTTDALQPDSDPVAFGQVTQPLLYEAGYLFNARSQPYSSSVILTRTDRDELKSDWQAALGSRPLAWNAANGMLICVNDTGIAFRVGDRQWASGKFATEASARLPLHQDLVDPLRATVVSGNRIAVVCGDPEPRAWVINASGQVEASPNLPQAPTAAPVMIGDRIVIPMAGRMHAIRTSSQPAIQDFTLPTGEEHQWVDVVATGADRALAVTTEGVLIQVRLQSSPRTHLAEGGRLELGAPVSVGLGASDQYVAIADMQQRLTVLRSEQLEQVGQRSLGGPISSRPLVVGNQILADVGLEVLHCVEPQGDLATRWTFPLNGAPLLGAEETASGLLLVQQNGTISLVDPASGDVLTQQVLATPLALGPLNVGQNVFVASIDGTVVPVTFE